MKNEIPKLWIAFVILIVLLIILTGVVFIFTADSLSEKQALRDKMRFDGIIDTQKMLSDNLDNTLDSIRDRAQRTAELMCAALQKFVTADGYEGPWIFDDGMVLRTEGDTVIYPEEFNGVIKDSGNRELTADDLRTVPAQKSVLLEKKGESGPEEMQLTAKEITEDLWYVTITDIDQWFDTRNLNIKFNQILQDVEKTYDCRTVVLWLNNEYDHPLYHSNDLSEEDIEKAVGDIRDRKYILTIGDTMYSAMYSEMSVFQIDALVAVLLDFENENQNISSSIFISAFLILVIMTAVIFWLYLVQRYVQEQTLSESQAVAYHPHWIKQITATIGFVAFLLVFILTYTQKTISNLYHESVSNRSALQVLMTRYSNNVQQTSTYQKDEEDKLEYFAERTAKLLSVNPEYRSHAFLEKAAEIIGCDYIMLFDQKGKEIAASNSYTGFMLGTKEDDPTTDFRRLLHGVDSIVHEPEVEPVSGNLEQLAGAGVRLNEEGQFGAVILAADPERTWMTAEKSEMAEFINLITAADSISAIADKETGVIRYSSDDDLIDESAADVGLETGNNTSSSLDSFSLENNTYYGAFDEDEQNRFFYLTDDDYIQTGVLMTAVSFSFGFLIIYVITAVYMLRPYREEAYEKSLVTSRPVREDSVLDSSIPDDRSQNGKWDFRAINISDRWNQMPPENRVITILQIFLSVAAVFEVVHLSDRSSVIGFILQGDWKRGPNLLALCGISLLLAFCFIFLLLKNTLTKILGKIIDPKGITIWKLIMSLVQYMTVIGLIYFSFGYLGFSTTVTLTSVGVLSLAVSLGSKDLVADILAGVFLVFEDDFHVGDIIEVNGFRGKVLEIGVRSTRMIGMGDNIKIFGNQSVKNILNMSRMNSWYTMELNVTADQPLADIEAMLERELPAIGASIPEIISGPYYKGVWSISNGKNTFSVITECREENIRRVQREVNKAIRVLFDENGYKLS